MTRASKSSQSGFVYENCIAVAGWPYKTLFWSIFRYVYWRFLGSVRRHFGIATELSESFHLDSGPSRLDGNEGMGA